MTPTCPACGTQLGSDDRGRPRVFCSRACAGAMVAARNRAARAAIIEDLEWLLDAGEAPAAILTRLDTTAEALNRRLGRAGRSDLAAHFQRLRTRPCADCGTTISHGARRCRSCAMTHHYRKAA